MNIYSTHGAHDQPLERFPLDRNEVNNYLNQCENLLKPVSVSLERNSVQAYGAVYAPLLYAPLVIPFFNIRYNSWGWSGRQVVHHHHFILIGIISAIVLYVGNYLLCKHLSPYRESRYDCNSLNISSKGWSNSRIRSCEEHSLLANNVAEMMKKTKKILVRRNTSNFVNLAYAVSLVGAGALGVSGAILAAPAMINAGLGLALFSTIPWLINYGYNSDKQAQLKTIQNLFLEISCIKFELSRLPPPYSPPPYSPLVYQYPQN